MNVSSPSILSCVWIDSSGVKVGVWLRHNKWQRFYSTQLYNVKFELNLQLQVLQVGLYKLLQMLVSLMDHHVPWNAKLNYAGLTMQLITLMNESRERHCSTNEWNHLV